MRVLFIALLLFINTSVLAEILPSTHFKTVQIFINEMVQEHDFNKSELQFIFSKIQLKRVDKSTQKKSTATSSSGKMSWQKYQSLFVTEDRIDSGVIFWKNNKQTLLDAEIKYGVPSEIIVAILGIETNYGKVQGKYPTLKTLIGKAFGTSSRRSFYRKELQSFLLLARENTLPPLAIKGSSAGALGYAQFIPSSYRYYAVDFNNDFKVDLFNNTQDAIGSIANYLAKHNWQNNGEIITIIELDKDRQSLAQTKISKPTHNAQHWRELGVDIGSEISEDTKLAFIRLKGDQSMQTWLTFWNFYAITRYNHDNRYAMTVYQLSEQLKQAFTSTI
ncbi:MAG: lytic murein transglycosylase B [Gammaproteobacteria bacterium]|nr:lytic murein transglycosylase B [Gammaproteobacteria bacterium]